MVPSRQPVFGAPGLFDPALRRFVEEPDEGQAEVVLSRLLEHEAAPLARRIAARKLRAFGRSEGSLREDVEDITAEVLLGLVARLRTLRADPSDSIESLADYTAVITYNAFAHYLRRRHPGRSRLKSRVRYVLTRDRRFALWTTPEGLACGLAQWNGRPPAPEAARAIERLATEPDAWLRGTARASERDLSPLTAAVLHAIGGAVEFDRLVGALAVLSPSADVREDTRELASLPDPAAVPADVALDRRRMAERTWAEVGELPLRQRFALLLNLRDGSGAGMLWALPALGLATVRQIARALGLADPEMADLWNRLPLDDLAIAERLGCTRQQVINLRSAARKRLTTRLGGFLGPADGWYRAWPSRCAAGDR